MRRSMYRPLMISDVRSCCLRCDACARERVKLRTHQSPLTLFPANGPLEYVAVDILSPLLRATSGHRFILVMTDRFSKFTRAVAMRTITAIAVAKVFLEFWIFSYGASAHVVTDNGSQFTSKMSEFLCSHLGVRQALTSTYHPQTNGQAERFNRTLLASLRAFVGEHPKTWPEFVGAVTYAYNTQVHASTKVPPFDLVVTAPPAAMVIERTPEFETTASHPSARNWFRRYIRSLVTDAKEELAKSQASYKEAFDRHGRPLTQPQTGEWVFAEQAGPTEDASSGERRRDMLTWKATGPYEVVAHHESTVTLDRDGLVEKVNRDRVSRAYHRHEDGMLDAIKDRKEEEKATALGSLPKGGITHGKVDTEVGAKGRAQVPKSTVNLPTTHDSEADPRGSLGKTHARSAATPSTPRVTPRGVTQAKGASQPLPVGTDAQLDHQPTEAGGEYVLDRVVDFDERDGIRCRWHGYGADADTWQKPGDVPYSKVRAFFRRQRKKTPRDLRLACRPC